jgi:epoxide hydrolase-like predicted phosphatase
MSYHGLILDFGGVVTTDFYGALRAFCIRQGLPADAFVHALRDTPEGRRALADVETGQISQRAYEKTIAQLIGTADEGLLGRALADLQPRSGMLDFVKHVRAAGVTVGVLSNSWGTGDYDPYQGYDLQTTFDAVVISDQVGLRKPDPEIYRRTATALGIAPHECIFVDDTEANLPTARQLGMAVVHFTDTATGIAEISRLLALA